jgi:hypothetical protein
MKPMKREDAVVPTEVKRRRSKKWIVGGIALASFLAGTLMTAHLTHANRASADRDRVFELDVYHAVPGKVPALVARFADASKLQAKHGLNVVGYWVPDNNHGGANTFVYLIAHRNREEAKKNWAAFHADPEFQKYVKSEAAEQLIETVDETYMSPTDFSSLR